MAKSYYTILGVSPHASRQEVKDAYRRLAKQHHPDHEGGDCGKFRDIQEAYSALTEACDQRRQPPQEAPGARRVRVRVNPGREYAAPEPLIPDRGAPAGIRQRSRGRFSSAGPAGEDLFEWLLRNFF